MGSVNRPDCWYLYTVSPGRSRYHPNAARQNLPHNRSVEGFLTQIFMSVESPKLFDFCYNRRKFICECEIYLNLINTLFM